MVVSVDYENISCTSLEEYENCILEKIQLNDAEIWISENGLQDDYPCLGILVKEGNVVINFFGEDGNNYVTVGDEDNEEFYSFCNGQYETPGYQIIDKETACAVIMEFFLTKEKSEKVGWEEL